jgi:hypothetical protein
VAGASRALAFWQSARKSSALIPLNKRFLNPGVMSRSMMLLRIERVVSGSTSLLKAYKPFTPVSMDIVARNTLLTPQFLHPIHPSIHCDDVPGADEGLRSFLHDVFFSPASCCKTDCSTSLYSDMSAFKP